MIRFEQQSDHTAVRAVNELAFGRVGEAALVDKLRITCPDIISVVAILTDQIVGHCLFTPVSIQTESSDIQGMALGPIAVLPSHQRKGIGSQLIDFGLSMLRQQNCPFVVVLGHPDYYSRFEFVSASQHGIRCQWPGIPDPIFMALILDSETMKGVSGIANYREEFNDVT